MRKYYLFAAVFVVLCGCDQEEGASHRLCGDTGCECFPECLDTEKCVNGTCYDVNACVPECAPGKICNAGTCVDDTSCKPGCDPDEKCISGTCYGKDVCVPECKKDELCDAGTCRTNPDYCEGTLCRDDTTYCDNHVWTPCEPGEGCHLGACIKGFASECEAGTCSETGEACQGGSWVKCDGFDECQKGKCVTIEHSCTAGECSEDKAYRCNSEDVFEKCPTGYTCEGGECTEAFDEKEMLLWQLCEKDSDCDYGGCVFSLKTSRPLSSAMLGLTDVDEVSLSLLDLRIPEGFGVCSDDCTEDPSVCDEITRLSGGAAEFSCQLAIVGDAEYPPVDASGNAYALPFHEHMDANKMAVSPFAAMCRPVEKSHKNYSRFFCDSCTTSDQCGEKESCVKGMCLPHCLTKAMCPMGFECVASDGTKDLNVCFPVSGSCESCRDLDGDGQGYGHCAKARLDCDDLNPNVYYSNDLPSQCTDKTEDTNCNGYIDKLELLGGADHCSACGDVCQAGSGAEHFSRTCIKNSAVPLDDTNPDTYQFQCLEQCEPGWADCNGDLSDGCEVHLIEQVDEQVAVLSGAKLMSLDQDKDGFGSTDIKNHYYCCSSKPDVCYGLPYTLQNPLGYWAKVTVNTDHVYVSDNHDCDDTRSDVYPNAKELCDGLDNDCSPLTADGSGETLNIYSSSTHYDTKRLGDACIVYNQSSYSVCDPDGVVSCVSASDGTHQMVCSGHTSKSETGDQVCNGLDDDCDGLIDEHWEYKPCFVGGKSNALNADGSVNICLMGVLTCSSGTEKCDPLYTARTYDFIGDKIDSNCDGYDYDYTHAVFVRNYGTDVSDGSDSHPGTASSPVAGLNALTSDNKGALDRACVTVGGKNLCHDIIVDSYAGSSSVNGKQNGWASTDITVPAFDPKSLYNPGLKDPVGADHASIVNKLMTKDSKGHTSFNKTGTANTLLPGEVYPPKEVVRIWGGYDVSCTGGKCSWTKGTRTSTYSRSIYYSTAKELPQKAYTLISPRGTDYPMSLGLHNIHFEYAVDYRNTANYAGTTLTGVSCGSYGCSRLTLDNANIKVTSPDGTKHESYDTGDNDVYGDTYGWGRADGQLKDGVSAFGKKNYNAVDAYANNYSVNRCMFAYQYSGNDYLWKSHDSADCYVGRTIYSGDDAACGKSTAVRFSDLYAKSCHDGQKPIGGCGGIVTVNRGSNVVLRNGRNGYGYKGGEGAQSTDYTPGEGCNDESSWSENDRRVKEHKAQSGATAYNMLGGKYIEWLGYEYGRGGKTSDIEQYWAKADNQYYLNSVPGNGNGHHGMNGSGGGGGAVYHNYAYRDYSSTVYAGGGGAGGCGGHGGAAGGTGGSAIGVAIVSPEDGSESHIVIENGTVVTANGGGGSDGERGQNGVAGGVGGDGYGYAEEGTFFLDLYCMKATNGGNGGNGAGGGGGAGGRAGQAYAYFVVCNQNTIESDMISSLSDCNIRINDKFAINPNDFGNVTAKRDGADGAGGSDASYSGTGSGGNNGKGNSNSSEYGKHGLFGYCNNTGSDLNCL